MYIKLRSALKVLQVSGVKYLYNVIISTYGSWRLAGGTAYIHPLLGLLDHALHTLFNQCCMRQFA